MIGFTAGSGPRGVIGTIVTEASDAGTADSPAEERDAEGRSASGASGSPGGASGGTTEEPTTAERLPYDAIFDLLSNERRRFTLRYLRENGPTARGELAEELAAHENDKPREEVTSQERKRIDVSLYQCHLPRLEEYGVIETERSLEVELGPNAGQLFEFLDPDSDHDRGATPSCPIAAAAGLAGLGVWSVTEGWLATTGTVFVWLSLFAVLVIAGAQWLGRSGDGARAGATSARF